MRRAITTLGAMLLLCGLAAAPAQAQFGFEALDVTLTDAEGAPAMQAGSHPFAYTTRIDMRSELDPELGTVPAGGQVRTLSGQLPPGLVGNPFSVPRCEGVDFATIVGSEPALPSCSNSSVLGTVLIRAEAPSVNTVTAPVFNLVPSPGTAAKLGFLVVGSPVTVEVSANPDPPYNLRFEVENITQTVRFYESELTLWGNPSSPEHDLDRGTCGAYWFVGPEEEEGGKFLPEGTECPTSNPPEPFLTLPRSCEGPLAFSFAARGWEAGASASGEVETHDGAEPLGPYGCEKLGFSPEVSAQPTTTSASSATGLDFDLEVSDPGLRSEAGLADADITRAEVTLPEGVTINPSQAEGLATCSERELSREHAGSEFGRGCPAGAKVGYVDVRTPLLPGRTLEGSLFVAEPYENRFGSLIALYMVIREPKLGLLFRLAGEVSPDPEDGRLTTVFEDLPPYPFSHFHLHFREGARSPLITPSLCGDYETEAEFTPSSDPSRTFETTASFEIDSGPGGAPCPPGGTPPFAPGFAAGALSNQAGAHSPVALRLTRPDGNQDLVRFDADLPAGLVASLAGVAWCPEAAIAAAKRREGREELRSPSCPAASRIGSVLAGAGVGSQLTYVPGSVYLAGPYGGAPLSVVGIVPAVAGPFDVGTVVTRQALVVNPRTAEVTVDGALSDPIPHILAGIPLSVRDIRVLVDRPAFTLNPTSCAPMAFAARIWGGGANPFSLADDAPVPLATRYQAAGCAALGFKPRLGIRLKGATRRGGHPALRATYVPRPGHANLRRLALTFPRSEFVENAHFRTICTRVQYAAGPGGGALCPPGSAYGRVKAWTPLLDAPLSGPVYLRSSDNLLPDAVFALKGLIDAEVAVRIDSVKGRLRATVQSAPDVPVSRVVVQMRAGRKGLFVNSRDICKGTNRARANTIAQSGARTVLRPKFRPQGCGKKAKRGGRAGAPRRR